MNKTSKIIQICDIPVMYSIDMKKDKNTSTWCLYLQIKLTCSLTIKERLEKLYKSFFQTLYFPRRRQFIKRRLNYSDFR